MHSFMNNLALTSLLFYFSNSIFAQAAPKDRSSKIASNVELSYSGGASELHNLSVFISPYSQFIQFKSKDNQFYKFDCQVGKSFDHWLCDTPCDSGSMKVRFADATGFEEIEIEPFQVRLRKCDGTEDSSDPKVSSKTTLKFRLIK